MCFLEDLELQPRRAGCQGLGISVKTDTQINQDLEPLQQTDRR